MRTVFITGASRGIGYAAAESFAKAGYHLALCCKTQIDNLNTYGQYLHDTYGVDVLTAQTDVSDSMQVDAFVNEVLDTFGHIDVVIHNAGISVVGLITDLDDEGWNRILSTNLSSAFYISRAVLPSMIHRKSGHIINVSSVFGAYGASCEVAYSATKGGLNTFTRALAKEVAPSHIRVNAAAFGAIDTQMNDNLDQDEKNALAEEIPAGRFASADEAGDFLLHLALSPSYMTGQICTFDGAWY